MTPTVQELQTAASPTPPCIAAIVRHLESRPKAYYFAVGREGCTWPDTTHLGQSSRFSCTDPDEFTTGADFGAVLTPAILAKLGYALQNQSRIGVKPTFGKQRSSFQDTPATPAPWMEEVMVRMEELARLPANWDSYGARPVKPECLQYAIHQVLQACMHGATPAPSVVPTNTGGVMLEWHRGNIDLEVRVENHGEATVYYADATSNEQKEFLLDRSAEALASLLWKLTQRG